MSFGSNINSLQVSIGDKILIRGRTGNGKSTFINALMGKIKGIEFDVAKPENYFHTYVEMYQNIREKLPTSSISIRKIFDDNPDDNLIIQCLIPCFPNDDLNRIFSNLINNQFNIGFLNPLDVDISERISGGEKTRLALATRIYQMKTKSNKHILILDEPEQGSDPELVIGNIIEIFKDKTIIMISHMCECQLNCLNIKWNNKLNISYGKIEKIKN